MSRLIRPRGLRPAPGLAPPRVGFFLVIFFFMWRLGLGEDFDERGFAGEMSDRFAFGFREAAARPEDFRAPAVDVELGVKRPESPSSREVSVNAVIFVCHDCRFNRFSVPFFRFVTHKVIL